MLKKHANIHRSCRQRPQIEHGCCQNSAGLLSKVFYCSSWHFPPLKRHGRKRSGKCGAAGQDRKSQAGREQRPMCGMSSPRTQGTWWVGRVCVEIDIWRVIRVPGLSFFFLQEHLFREARLIIFTHRQFHCVLISFRYLYWDNLG